VGHESESPSRRKPRTFNLSPSTTVRDATRRLDCRYSQTLLDRRPYTNRNLSFFNPFLSPTTAVAGSLPLAVDHRAMAVLIKGRFEFAGKVVHEFTVPAAAGGASAAAGAASAGSPHGGKAKTPMDLVVEALDAAKTETNRFCTQEMNAARKPGSGAAPKAKGAGGKKGKGKAGGEESKEEGGKGKKNAGKDKGKGKRPRAESAGEALPDTRPEKKAKTDGAVADMDSSAS
jgi:hypothetical protein